MKVSSCVSRVEVDAGSSSGGPSAAPHIPPGAVGWLGTGQ